MPSEGIVASLVDEMSERFRAVSRPNRLSEAAEHGVVLFRPKPARALAIGPAYKGMAGRSRARANVRGALLRSRADERVRFPGGDDDLDGILDPIACVS
jgi:hypothetical protein